MKPILGALMGHRQPTPPIWVMRQAGRHLPEYRAVRARAGGFLELCNTPELAAEVTLQPVRRYGLDAAIIFADILPIAQALGAELSFVAGEGPRITPIASADAVRALRPADVVHEALAPVHAALRIVAGELAPEVALIGFAGAPWTVATYMIAGRGTPDQAPAHRFKDADRAAFTALIDRLCEATILYLVDQVEAGAEVLMLFDSWAGSLKGEDFTDFAVRPVARIVKALQERAPHVPIIGFPRLAGERYEGYAAATGVSCVALDDSVAPEWAAAHVQKDGCVQGNLAPRFLVSGGRELVDETRRIVRAFAGGPHIFNLGHGITPDADPDNVLRMIEAVRGG